MQADGESLTPTELEDGPAPGFPVPEVHPVEDSQPVAGDSQTTTDMFPVSLTLSDGVKRLLLGPGDRVPGEESASQAPHEGHQVVEMGDLFAEEPDSQAPHEGHQVVAMGDAAAEEPDSQPPHEGHQAVVMARAIAEGPDSQPPHEGHQAVVMGGAIAEEPDSQPPGEGHEAPRQGHPVVAMSEEERKRNIHRENSRAWHEKWVRKGVPRQNAGQPLPEPMPAGPMNMRDHANRFITEWVQNSEMPPSVERRRAACAAWMVSEERANLIAGRAGVQI